VLGASWKLRVQTLEVNWEKNSGESESLEPIELASDVRPRTKTGHMKTRIEGSYLSLEDLVEMLTAGGEEIYR
jgi:hypothetical protein